MNKPQLYNVELTSGVKNNSEYINALLSIYHVSKDNAPKIIDDINHGRKTIVAKVPLDIAKTISDVFLDTCRKNGYSSKISFSLSGEHFE